jgi:hypothetical protein
VNPGTCATVSTRPVTVSTVESAPRPDSSTHSRPRYSRGECGIDRPRATTSPLSTSSTTPPVRLFARQPSRTLLSPRALK